MGMASVRWTAGVLGCVLLAGGAIGAAPALAALVPGEWMDAYSLAGAPFALPAGGKIVGRVEGDRFLVGAAPGDLLRGLGAGRDCHNDLPGGTRPLTDNLLAPVLANVASAGECTGTRGLDGSISYLEFETTGTGGGRFVVSTQGSHFVLSCSGATSAVGFGVGAHWRTMTSWMHTICLLDMGPTPPSAWMFFDGSVTNYGEVGSSYGLVVV